VYLIIQLLKKSFDINSLSSFLVGWGGGGGGGLNMPATVQYFTEEHFSSVKKTLTTWPRVSSGGGLPWKSGSDGTGPVVGEVEAWCSRTWD